MKNTVVVVVLAFAVVGCAREDFSVVPDARGALDEELEERDEDDDGDDGNDEEPPAIELPAEPTVCDIAVIANTHCVSCHGGAIAPLLTLDGLRQSVNAPADLGGVLVAPGAPDASLLFRKIAGVGPDDGAPMPLGAAPLDDNLVAAVRSWIERGASADCAGAPEPELPPPPPAVIEPGAAIVLGNPPSGFARTPPRFADGTSCSTSQWWQFEDDEEESFLMHPGHACIDCHARSDDDDAPRFRYAGTVMADLRDEDDCRGVPGVRVEILNANDAVVATATTNQAGNFGLSGQFIAPWRVRLSLDGRTREMFGHVDAAGDCQSCHTQAGRNGAPGRIVAP